MAQQKLYTEEQVKYILDLAQRSGVHIAKISVDVDKKLIPIELPSDENIEEKAEFLFPTVNRMGGPTYIAHKSFIEGAKWMKDKLLTK